MAKCEGFACIDFPLGRYTLASYASPPPSTSRGAPLDYPQNSLPPIPFYPNGCTASTVGTGGALYASKWEPAAMHPYNLSMLPPFTKGSVAPPHSFGQTASHSAVSLSVSLPQAYSSSGSSPESQPSPTPPMGGTKTAPSVISCASHERQRSSKSHRSSNGLGGTNSAVAPNLLMKPYKTARRSSGGASSLSLCREEAKETRGRPAKVRVCKTMKERPTPSSHMGIVQKGNQTYDLNIEAQRIKATPFSVYELEEGFSTHWSIGYNRSVGDIGRKLLLKEIREYHNKDPDWTQDCLEKEGLFYSEVRFMRVSQLYHYMHALGAFEYALKVSLEFGSNQRKSLEYTSRMQEAGSGFEAAREDCVSGVSKGVVSTEETEVPLSGASSSSSSSSSPLLASPTVNVLPSPRFSLVGKRGLSGRGDASEEAVVACDGESDTVPMVDPSGVSVRVCDRGTRRLYGGYRGSRGRLRSSSSGVSRHPREGLVGATVASLQPYASSSSGSSTSSDSSRRWTGLQKASRCRKRRVEDRVCDEPRETRDTSQRCHSPPMKQCHAAPSTFGSPYGLHRVGHGQVLPLSLSARYEKCASSLPKEDRLTPTRDNVSFGYTRGTEVLLEGNPGLADTSVKDMAREAPLSASPGGVSSLPLEGSRWLLPSEEPVTLSPENKLRRSSVGSTALDLPFVSSPMPSFRSEAVLYDPVVQTPKRRSFSLFQEASHYVRYWDACFFPDAYIVDTGTPGLRPMDCSACEASPVRRSCRKPIMDSAAVVSPQASEEDHDVLGLLDFSGFRGATLNFGNYFTPANVLEVFPVSEEIASQFGNWFPRDAADTERVDTEGRTHSFTLRLLREYSNASLNLQNEAFVEDWQPLKAFPFDRAFDAPPLEI